MSDSTQTALEQSPIQLLTKLNIAGLQWSYENWYIKKKVDKPLLWMSILASLFFKKKEDCEYATNAEKEQFSTNSLLER